MLVALMCFLFFMQFIAFLVRQFLIEGTEKIISVCGAPEASERVERSFLTVSSLKVKNLRM